MFSSRLIVSLYDITNIMDKLITDDKLRQGAEEGMDAFLKVFTDAYLEVIEGELTAERARFKFT